MGAAADVSDQRFAFLLFAPQIVHRDHGRLSPGGIFARRRAAVDALLFEEIAARRADPCAAEPTTCCRCC